MFIFKLFFSFFFNKKEEKSITFKSMFSLYLLRVCKHPFLLIFELKLVAGMQKLSEQTLPNLGGYHHVMMVKIWTPVVEFVSHIEYH